MTMRPLAPQLDEIDRTLLALLQEDASLSHVDLARQVGLSAPGVHKRLKHLRQGGYIKKVAAVLDRARLGLDLLCFLKVTFRSNLRPENVAELQRCIQELPEVLECYTVTGSSDAILKIAVTDHFALRDFLRRLAEGQQVIERAETCIVLEEFKEGAELPLRPV
ncbi:Lrp/AsnC family transcriptional regulator [Deinococcus planocerae]|uniref:Lrp/AsnC family transcriptional regulator n=1 Tax=Deinococcus planocerae TaxID=1737569 RepID=UPI001FE9899D|nr:Lrp/AsnC family transcriptional regulator [Deinococcus planocerae]